MVASTDTNTAKKPAPAKAPKAPKITPLDVEGLMERTLAVIAGVRGWTGLEDDEVVAAMDVCRAAGRADLAKTLADSIPAAPRGRALVNMALAGEVTPEQAVEAVLGGLSGVVRCHGACPAAGFALHAAHLLPHASGREALMEAAGELVDRCFAADLLDGFEPVVRAYFELGEHARVVAMIERVGAKLPDSLARGLWALGSPAKILPRVDKSNVLAVVNSAYIDLTRWSLSEMSELVALTSGTWARLQLAKVLVASGRVDEARTLVIDDPEWSGLGLIWQVERYSLVGDAAAAKDLLRGSAPPADQFMVWARMQREHGLLDFDALCVLAAKRGPKDSMMSAIEMLTLLIEGEVDAGATQARVEPALATIDALFADPFRTQYDQGVEGTRRNDVALLRARLDLASGQRARAQAQVEADFAEVSMLLSFAKDSYSKAALLTGFLHRAALVGRPEIALKAAKLIPKMDRPRSATAAARAFLPGAPGDALKALDKLAPDPLQRLLGDPGLLAALWSAVLSAGVPAA